VTGGRSSKLIDEPRNTCGCFEGGADCNSAFPSVWLAIDPAPTNSCDCSGVGRAFGAALADEDLVALREDVFLIVVVFVEVAPGLVDFVVFPVGEVDVEVRVASVVLRVILRVLGMLLKSSPYLWKERSW